jgi:ascorbate-specific PTS system EIIC-type component UlaA
VRTTLLVLHIIGVAIWLGANGVLAFAGPRAAGAGPEVRSWWADTQGAMARVLYNAAGVLVLLTGIGLVLQSDEVYRFSDTFVSIGFLAVIVGAGLGMGVFGPGTRRLSDAIRSNDGEAERQVSSRLQAFGILDTLVLVVTIVAMVGKWGWG